MKNTATSAFFKTLIVAFSSLLFTAAIFAQKGDKTMSFQIKSSAFENGQPIPVKYTGQGKDVSPPLEWANPPAGTKSFAIINDDPDAPVGTWVHWVIYDIPANVTKLPENVPAKETLPDGSKQGLNDWGRVGYGGPMPPPGKPHRYFFKIYALDTVLNLKPRATKAELLKAMQGHILAQAELMGTYQRK
jgi:Raf kinase inhibitor-like YbhB/YbcL family protein